MGITSHPKPVREQLAWYWLWTAVAGIWTVYTFPQLSGADDLWCWMVLTVSSGVGVLMGAMYSMSVCTVLLMLSVMEAGFLLWVAIFGSLDVGILGLWMGVLVASVGLAPAMACALLVQYLRRAIRRLAKPAATPGC